MEGNPYIRMCMFYFLAFVMDIVENFAADNCAILKFALKFDRDIIMKLKCCCEILCGGHQTEWVEEETSPWQCVVIV